MPIAHACRGCGQALSFIRAALDHSLGLPVVVCPGCGMADVRRRHPLNRWWRSGLRLARSTISLVPRVAVFPLLAGGCFAAAGFVGEGMGSVSIWALIKSIVGIAPDPALDAFWRGRDGPTILAAATGWYILVGTILTVAFSHWRRRWLILPAFALWLAAVWSIAMLFTWVDGYRSWPMSGGTAPVMPPTQGSIDFRETFPWLAVALCGMPLAYLGVPPGRLIDRLAAARRSRVWRKRLARARTRRDRA